MLTKQASFASCAVRNAGLFLLMQPAGKPGLYAGTRGRDEVLGLAGVVEDYSYALEGVLENQESKISTNSSNSTTPACPNIFSLTRVPCVRLIFSLLAHSAGLGFQKPLCYKYPLNST